MGLRRCALRPVRLPICVHNGDWAAPYRYGRYGLGGKSWARQSWDRACGAFGLVQSNFAGSRARNRTLRSRTASRFMQPIEAPGPSPSAPRTPIKKAKHASDNPVQFSHLPRGAWHPDFSVRSTCAALKIGNQKDAQQG